VKPNGLGRGLGQLMESRPTSKEGGASAVSSSQHAVSTSAGVKILLGGTSVQPAAATRSNGHAAQPSPVSAPARPERSFIPESLIAADLLLSALACRLILAGTPVALDWVLAGTSLLLGGWAGSLGVAQLLKRNATTATLFTGPLAPELPFSNLDGGSKN
jgi:hypothetical protein